MRFLLIVVFIWIAASSDLSSLINSHWRKFQSSTVASDLLIENSIKKLPGHKCAHHEKMRSSGLSGRYKGRANFNSIEKRSAQAISQVWTPIRVYVDSTYLDTSDLYSCATVGENVEIETGETISCRSSDLLTTTKITLLQQHIIPALVDLITKLLSVQSTSGNLILSKDYHDFYGYECRENLFLPNSLTSVGKPNCDYYLFVTARPLESDSILANALPCSHTILPGDRYSRPLAGSINFNPANLNIDPNDEWEFQQLMKTAIHEMTHALGFTSNLFYDYMTSPANSLPCTASRTNLV